MKSDLYMGFASAAAICFQPRRQHECCGCSHGIGHEIVSTGSTQYGNAPAEQFRALLSPRQGRAPVCILAADAFRVLDVVHDVMVSLNKGRGVTSHGRLGP